MNYSSERISWFWELDTKTRQMLMIVHHKFPIPANTHELETLTELSRSATLKRCHELVDRGIFIKKIRPGTEARKYPPFIFSLSPEFKEKLDKLAPIQEYKTPKNLNLTENQQSPQTPLWDSGSDEQQHTSLLAEKENTEDTRQTIQTPIEEPESFDEKREDDSGLNSKNQQKTIESEQDIGTILKKMAQEIVSLKNRVFELEQKLEQSKPAQIANSGDIEQVLRILESPQPSLGENL